MKRIFNKDNLLRLKKLLLTKEAILILAALVVVIVFVLVRGGEDPKPPARQGGGIIGMSESAGTPHNTQPAENTMAPPPESEPPSELLPPEVSPESDTEAPPPESGEEPPDSELPPDDTVDSLSSVIPPPGMTPPGATPSGIQPSDVLDTTPPPSADAAPEPEQPEATPDAAPDAPPDAPPESIDASSPPPSETPGSVTGFAPPPPPTVSFKYIWSGSSFKPCADISWTAETAELFKWQLCGANGNVLLEGEIPASGGAAARLSNFAFDTSAESQNGLYPKGYILKLTPHYSGGTLAPHVMELPYFEVAAQRIDGQLLPVIATNIGLYFVHSFESLTDTETGGKIRITGSLLPNEGAQTPLNIDVLSK